MSIARLVAAGAIPVVRAADAALARRAIDALAAGGMTVFEVTMTVPGAPALIAELVRAFADAALIGAGTVLDRASAEACLDAGASFVVSPALRPEVIAACQRRGVPVLPGALTPSEILAARDAGAELVKVFPVAAVGGPAYVRLLLGPFPDLQLVPTGGVTLENAAEYLRAGAAAVGLGSDLVDLAAIRAGRAAAVTAKARELLASLRDARR